MLIDHTVSVPRVQQESAIPDQITTRWITELLDSKKFNSVLEALQQPHLKLKANELNTRAEGYLHTCLQSAASIGEDVELCIQLVELLVQQGASMVLTWIQCIVDWIASVRDHLGAVFTRSSLAKVKEVKDIQDTIALV